MPKVSVVLPVYNGERYLEESISSVLIQDFTDFELIIWDDVSTDKSGDIIASQGDRRIRVFRNETNKGLFKTLNLAIFQSRGELIRLWSQDDIMKPGCLKEEAAFHEQHPEIGMSYCAWDMINEKREVIKPYQEDKTPEILSQRLALQLMFYYGSIPGNISTVMMKRRALNDVGTFKESMRQAGDFDMWVRIAYKFPMGFINRPLIYLRRHKEQYSRAEGEGAFHVCEVNTIVRGLVENLPCEIKMISRVYNRWNRHIRHFHHMVKEISLGRFKDAAIICREIMKEDNILLVAMLWFFTGNGRFFKEKLKVKFYV